MFSDYTLNYYFITNLTFVYFLLYTHIYIVSTMLDILDPIRFQIDYFQMCFIKYHKQIINSVHIKYI